ncbi:MAG: phosphoenolpyruvate synthase [Candidatus Omnitrophota bacterium]
MRIVISVILASFVLSSLPNNGYAGLGNADKLRVKAADNGQRMLEMQQELIQEIMVSVSKLRNDDLGKAVSGGKGANLGELGHVAGIQVPKAVALTTKAFRMHIDSGKVEVKNYIIAAKINYKLAEIMLTKKNLEEDSGQSAGKVFKPSGELGELEGLIQEYENVIELANQSPEQTKSMTLRDFFNFILDGLDYESKALGWAGQLIREAVESAEMPKEVEDVIRVEYQKMCDEAGVPDVEVAVRSSATAEDLPDASFAGQQDTYLNIRGINAVLAAVKSDWASLYTDRALYYRQNKGYDHGLAYLSVIIQNMVDADVAGVVFGVDVNTGMPGFTANANWGLGESVVGGDITPDTFKGTYNLKTGEPIITEQIKGTKEKKVVYRKEPGLKAKESTKFVSTTEKERNSFSLTKKQIKELAKAVRLINKHYGKYMDVEWAFNKKGELWILQARPDTIWNKKLEDYPDTVIDDISGVTEEAKKDKEVILSGISGAPKAASGKVVILKDDSAEEIDRVKIGDILVATMTKPDMVPAMKRCAGIITDEGGLTCHAAIVARELEVPCTVGTKNATQVLIEGEVVTVDGNEGKVYKGALEIVKDVRYTKIKDLRPTKTELGIINSSDDVAMKIWQYSNFISYYGYGLFREEFAHTTKILIHPLAGLVWDKAQKDGFKDAQAKEWAEKNVLAPYGQKIEGIIAAAGYSPLLEREIKTYDDFFIHQLAQTLIKTASAQMKGQRIKARTVDFKTNEYANQVSGLPFEPTENNPMLGFRGVYRMLDVSYREAFILELKAIKLARKFQPNIDIMLPVVRTVEEMVEAVELMAEVGLFDGEDKPQIGIMVETSSIIFQSDDFYRTLAVLAQKYGTKPFMSIGSNDLTQFTLGLGRDNEKMLVYFDEGDPAMLVALEIVIKKAAEYGIWSGYCGQRPSNDPKFAAFLVRCGIKSISVVKDVYAKVNQVIADEEAKLVNVPFDSVIANWVIPQQAGNPRRINSVEVDANEIIKKLGIHPLFFLGYDGIGCQFSEEIIRGELKEKFGGKSAKEYVVNFIFKAIMAKVAATPKDMPIIYTTEDLEKNAAELLLGGEKYEMYDENPHLGLKGLEKVVESGIVAKLSLSVFNSIKGSILDPNNKNGVWEEVSSATVRLKTNVALKEEDVREIAGDDFEKVWAILQQSYFKYEEFYRWQLEAIKMAREVSGRKNIGIRLDSPTKLGSVEKALKIMKEAGLVPGVDGFMSGMEIAKPANVLVLGKYIDLGINFLSENTEGLLSYLLALDPRSPYIRINDRAKELALENPRRIWTTLAESRKIPIIQSNGEVLTSLDRKVNSGFDTRANDRFVSIFEKSDIFKGALVVGANAVFENSFLSALRKIKETKIGIAITVWANDQAAVDKLKRLGVEEVADIIISDGLNAALDAVKKQGVHNINITLINSPEDLENIKKEFNFENISQFKDLVAGQFVNDYTGIKLMNLQAPNAKENILNNIPLVIARAVTGIFSENEGIVKQYQNLSQGFVQSNKDNIDEKTLAAINSLNDVSMSISEVPLVKVTEESAKAQAAYETALEAVGISG